MNEVLLNATDNKRMLRISIHEIFSDIFGCYVDRNDQFTHSFAFQPFAQDQKWLLGDWNGKRNELAQQGYQFNLAFQNESATNLKGAMTTHRSFSTPINGHLELYWI